MADLVASIDGLLKKRGSPLAGLGNVFVAAGQKYGVDPRLVVGISGIESSFGKYSSGAHNAWGWGPGIPFGSWEQGISHVTKGLADGYIRKGLTDPGQIVRKYAPSSDGNNEQGWADAVGSFMRELGGNPGSYKSVRTTAVKPPPSLDMTPSLLPPSAMSSSTAMPGMNLDDVLIGAGPGINPDRQVRNLVQTMLTQPQIFNPPKLSLPAMPGLRLPAFDVPSAGALGNVKVGDPIPVRFQTSIGPEHPTSGLPGYPAHDYMSHAGAPVVAPISGKIIRFSGHDPARGPTQGVHGPFGLSLYLRGTNGRTYYLTHLGSRAVRVGQHVRAGQPIATVGNYAKWGGADHVHMGVSGPAL